MRNVLLLLAVAFLASCSKTKSDQKCYTCYYANTWEPEDFCGTDKELADYIEFKKNQKRPVTCK